MLTKTMRRMAGAVAVAALAMVLTAVGCTAASPASTDQADQPAGDTAAARAGVDSAPAGAPSPAPAQDPTPAPDPMGRFAAEPSFHESFDPGWKPGDNDWRVATWKQNGTLMSPERAQVNDAGHMVQTVLPGEPYRGGSMQTEREFGYGRWIARVRPSSVPGALHSIFTKDWDDLTTEAPGDGNKFEIDIEFLTYTFGPGRGRVHLAIHKQGQSNAFVRDPELDFNPSDDFHVWGFDVLPDRVVWHVDGRELATWKVPDGEIVPVGYEFFFNSWTKPNWIKGPPKEPAHYHIDWVKFHPLKPTGTR
jgi:beta-glucanase (GH16 family)